MLSPFRSRWVALVAPLLLLLLFATAACSKSAQTGTVGTAGSNSGGDAFRIAFDQTFITIENLTGSPIVDGRIEIVPRGVRPPFTTAFPRLENHAKREIPLRDFRGNDGTEFSRRVAHAQRVRITAVDVAGKKYEMEVPVK